MLIAYRTGGIYRSKWANMFRCLRPGRQRVSPNRGMPGHLAHRLRSRSFCNRSVYAALWSHRTGLPRPRKKFSGSSPGRPVHSGCGIPFPSWCLECAAGLHRTPGLRSGGCPSIAALLIFVVSVPCSCSSYDPLISNDNHYEKDTPKFVFCQAHSLNN